MSRYKYLIPVLYCVLIIGVFVFQALDADLIQNWAILPHHPAFLKGIVTAVFIHANIEHLSSNILPFAVCIFGLFYFYHEIALKVTFLSHLLTGLLIWCFARPVFHVGASGLVYAMVLFILSGWTHLGIGAAKYPNQLGKSPLRRNYWHCIGDNFQT
jgi:membrane associated rhomboid family serine protease